jgi:cytochrome c553
VKRTPPLADAPPEESFEPYEEFKPIPLPVLMIAVALALWGIFMLLDNSKAVTIGQSERSDQIADLPRANPQDGAQLFASRCATCHQPNGSGVRDAIPPLADSPFLKASPDVAMHILLNGIDGPIRVGEATYDGHMPSFASVLSDAEIARLISHVRATFVDRRDPLLERDVAIARAGRRGAWQGGQELAMRLDASLAPQPSMPTPAPAVVDPLVERLVSRGSGAAWACASCHGVRGQGSTNIPRLAGLPAEYIAKQLGDYVAGRRRNETMQIVARALKPGEMRRIGTYYSSMRAPSNARASLGGDLARGARLVLEGDWDRGVPSCVSCHGPSTFGVAPRFPALSAQHPEYTAAQLTAWISGVRDNSTGKLMNGIARRLNDADRRAVADYLATLPPVPASATKGRTDVQ